MSEELRDAQLKAFLKRAHSKAWHAAKLAAKNAGKTDDQCKADASEAGTAVLAKLRKLCAEGKINHNGVDAEDVS